MGLKANRIAATTVLGRDWDESLIKQKLWNVAIVRMTREKFQDTTYLCWPQQGFLWQCEQENPDRRGEIEVSFSFRAGTQMDFGEPEKLVKHNQQSSIQDFIKEFYWTEFMIYSNMLYLR